MNTRTYGCAFYLTFVLPVIHVSLCVAAGSGVLAAGWLLLTWIDFPIGLLLGGLAFSDNHFMLWFGVFGTLWWYFLSWAAWRIWGLEQRRIAKGTTSLAEAAPSGTEHTEAQAPNTEKK